VSLKSNDNKKEMRCFQTNLEFFSLFHFLITISGVNQRFHHDVIQLRKQLQSATRHRRLYVTRICSDARISGYPIRLSDC